MKYHGFDEIVDSDVAVVGGGIAGMTVALGVAPHSVNLVSKLQLGYGSSSRLAQGGVAAALGEEDSPDLHAQDTLAVGGGLCDPSVVDIITREGPRQIHKLVDLGARFDSDSSGQILLGREAAHSRRRIVHANGDSTGAEIVTVLTDTILERGSVGVMEDCFAADLAVANGRVVGVIACGERGRILCRARTTVLATGGIGSVFAFTTNPPEATGDGLAMAARAGVQLSDLEFVQFHPTALACDHSPMPLLTEALRGEGAVLIDESGRRFMLKEHPLAELAPRDIVSRAIWRQLQEGNRVFLDGTDAVGDRFPERFPTVFRLCAENGLDPRTEPIPVSPAAHYHIGGVTTDARGRSSMPGLWACGETAATRVHGANRLASNSLLEALVFGSRVAEDVRLQLKSVGVLPGQPFMEPNLQAPAEDEDVKERVRAIMWDKVGLIRDEIALSQALHELSHLKASFGSSPGETRNLLAVAELVTSAGLARKESRGVHFRSDYPEPDRGWDRHLFHEPTPWLEHALA
jgi:L-aspartate oxidase